jgi:hypothetical protein
MLLISLNIFFANGSRGDTLRGSNGSWGDTFRGPNGSRGDTLGIFAALRYILLVPKKIRKSGV